MTEVRNIRDGTYDPTNPEHVYVGRWNGRYKLKQHPLHNPYEMRTEKERERVLRSYDDYLGGRPDLQEIARGLRGKVLYCWCAPRACHAEIIARYAAIEAHAGPLPEWARDPDATRHFRETGEEPSPYDYVPF